MIQTNALPVSIVIFGAKGDLTRRKLIPALYNLYIADHLPAQFKIVLVDYLEDVKDAFKTDLLAGINSFSRTGKAEEKAWKKFASNLVYQKGDFLADETYDNLKTLLHAFDTENKVRGKRMFYYAVAPRFIENVSEGLYKSKICNKVNKDRIVVEKPFGTDLSTAKKLNKFLQERFDEKQIFRIDHYLGKETVQNIMAFRFANYVFEPLWNNKYIDYVQISVAEEVSVGSRGGYYDTSGALRDMIQNHLLQLLCVIAMECPAKYDAEAIRDAKLAVLKKIRLYDEKEVAKNVVRAQYTAGEINNKPQVAYTQEASVSPQSTTETFIAVKFLIDNDRWKNVPFFFRTGKCLPKQSSVIVLQFKDSPNKIFKDDLLPNRLIISIQPEQEISLVFESKVPGVEMKLKPVEMDFTYKDSYDEQTPEAYESLLLDVIMGNATLFMRADQVEAAWKVVMPIIDAWKKQPQKSLLKYKAGTWGPTAANTLLKPFCNSWITLSNEVIKKD